MRSFIYSLIRRKQDHLKRSTDRRYEGIWLGSAPKLIKDHRGLRAGDVLFCSRGRKGWLAELIQNTTDGVYTHCGIYVGKGQVIHADRQGVQEISLEDFITDYAYIAVTRCPGTGKRRSRKILNFARDCANKRFRYNLIGAALVPLLEYLNIKKHYDPHDFRKFLPPKSGLPKLLRKRFFCSQFVVQCYIECGYIDADDRYYQSRYWSPTGLAEENIFELIGFMSKGGLSAVDHGDPHLAGNAWVLADEGQRRLKAREQELDDIIATLPRRGINPGNGLRRHH